jgi:hypothetical protein
MKRKMLTLAIITFMAVLISPSYAQEPDKKSVKARENLKEEQKDVVQAKKKLKEAQRDSTSEYQKFKSASEMKIRDNEKDIADLKAKHSKMNAKENAIYQAKVSDLEQKNNALQKKLTNYKKDDEKSKWIAFRDEFNSDLNKLGKALKEFTVSHKK